MSKKTSAKKVTGPIQHRQGDVYLEEVTSIPAGAKLAKDCVVALGAATGHSHRVEAGAEQYVAGDGTQFLKVLKRSATLKHHEHASIRLAGPKIYKIGHQREFTPAGDAAVLD